MDIFEAIRTRRSVRAYTDKKVGKDAVAKIIDAGRFAATARNEQPWEFVVTFDKEKLMKLSAMCSNGAFMKDASCLIAIFSKDTKYYIEDCSAATQNMLLAIHALGLGACWIAGDKKPYADDVRDMFGVQGSFRLVSMISVGYPKGNISSVPKISVDELLHWEKW